MTRIRQEVTFTAGRIVARGKTARGKENGQYADKLMQALLREAFEGV